MNFDINDIMQKIIKKTKQNVKRIGESFPYNEIDGKYIKAEITAWTNGYWPGLLWQVYDVCNDKELMYLADMLEKKLDTTINTNTVPGHDVGFVWLLTSGQNYKHTKNPESKRRLIQMANYLAGRFNIVGRYIRAWDSEDGNQFFPVLRSLIVQ